MFKVAGDRNISTDLLKKNRKTVHASEADLKYEAGAATDVTKLNGPYLCKKILHSFFLNLLYQPTD